MYVCKMNVLEGESDLELISFQFFILHFGFHPIDSFSSKSHKISFTYIVQYVLNTYTAHIWRCSVKNWNWYNYDNNTTLNFSLRILRFYEFEEVICEYFDVANDILKEIYTIPETVE